MPITGEHHCVTRAPSAARFRFPDNLCQAQMDSSAFSKSTPFVWSSQNGDDDRWTAKSEDSSALQHQLQVSQDGLPAAKRPDLHLLAEAKTVCLLRFSISANVMHGFRTPSITMSCVPANDRFHLFVLPEAAHAMTKFLRGTVCLPGENVM